jgi:heat-inducible transcriptional repressor
VDELTERQKLILTLVIHEYIRSALPVASNHLVQQYHLDLSSATIRNEMAELTERGYLRQLHTSAGRVPAEEGYRYFVGRLLEKTEMPDATRRTISHQFHQARHDSDQMLRLAASILAHQSKSASLVTAPHTRKVHFKHLELISTHGRQVLMVLVLLGGEIRQRLLTLVEPASQEQLHNRASRLSTLFLEKDVETIRQMRDQIDAFDLEMLDAVVEELTQADLYPTGDVYLDGLTNVLSEPEFVASEEARKALHLLEERSLLQDLLSRTMSNTGVGGVQVLIGGEGTWDELRQVSVILSRYGNPDGATGTLGVLGPLRMPYGKAISALRLLSGLMSEMVSDKMDN